MFSFFPILAFLAASNVKSYLKTDHVMLNKIKETSDGVVFVDVENVRGKSGFGLSHDEALSKTSIWTRHHELQDKVIFVVDHGSLKSGYYLKDRDLAVIFAGPSEKADDVIANGISLFGKSLVITADGELQSRCRRSARGEMHIMDPQKFLDDLETAYLKSDESQVAQIEEGIPLSFEEKLTLGQLDDEIRLRGQLLDAEIQLGKKGKKSTNKKRKKLQAKISKLRDALNMRGPSVLDRVTSIDPSFSTTESSLERDQQDLLLSRWRELQSRTSRREQTGDRVVYAERLRRLIMEGEDTVTDFSDNGDHSSSSSKMFVGHINGLVDQTSILNGSVLTKNYDEVQDDVPISPPEFSTKERLMQVSENGKNIDTLKMVVISDTHGFESQLIESGNDCLPNGDILLHLGDWTIEGSYEDEKRGMNHFDLWLAKQPHEYKIVIRGNHDPWTFDFINSGAWYITKPTSIMIGEIDLAMIPYGSSRKLQATGQLPSSCNILATHLPPFKILDRTYTNKHVGSSFLTKMVRSMKKNGSPQLWLCGHIHEGRGMKKHSFGDTETVIINAANANSGRATHLTHGPVVVKAEAKTKAIEIEGIEDKKIDQKLSNSRFFEHSNGINKELLLAVDLGLKSGVCLFNSDGKLIRYEQFTFDMNSLGETTKNIIKQWEEDVNNAVGSQDETPWRVTHIAVEGGDVAILNAWSSAAPDVSILRVSPEEWRSELLQPKEKLSGADCKAAARLIARQVVSDFGSMEKHNGKFKTDVAEAVVMGLYVSRKLGWITRTPAIRRYSNGNVVVPR